jgi:histidinol-phosphate aminotransferase
LGLQYHGIALLADDFALDLPSMLAAIRQHQPSVIFIAFPNNPTGNLFAESEICEILEAANGLVVVDEAYAPFANASFMAKLGHYDNLLVMRTVSKLGLAGLRLGYLVGKPELIGELDKIRLPYNINILTQLTANFALTHKDIFDQQTQLICTERSVVFEALKAMVGIFAFPSSANFILFRTPKGEANNIFASIKQQGVLIKNLNSQGGLLTDCLRVTIGTADENKAFLTALQHSLSLLS